jgi:hypothetical protein
MISANPHSLAVNAQLAAFAADCLARAAGQDVKQVHFCTISHKIHACVCARKSCGPRLSLANVVAIIASVSNMSHVPTALRSPNRKSSPKLK